MVRSAGVLPFRVERTETNMSAFFLDLTLCPTFPADTVLRLSGQVQQQGVVLAPGALGEAFCLIFLSLAMAT